MTATISPDLSNIIVDPLAYQNGDAVDEAFKAIRRDSPFAKAQASEYDNFWVVSRHADVMEIEKQASLFQNSPRSSTISPKATEGVVKFLTGGESNLIRSLVAVDGAEHKALRGIVFPAMTPQKVRGLEDDVRRIAKGYVQQMLDKGGACDFAEDIAFWYPLRVIMSVLGVPQEDEPYLLKLTQELFGASDPEMNRDKKEVTAEEALQGLLKTNADLEAYFAEVTKKFRANPDDAAVNSLIANATIDGEYLNHRQIMGYYIIAATAGHDTTSNTTAGALWALAERPELFARLKAEPELIGAFTEESIRWVTPVKHFMRTAVEDTEFRGQQIKAGEWLMLPYQSANRDEDVFDNPFEFSIDRKPNRHVAFGYGPHVCLGQHLARMEMRVLWEELLPLLGSVELDGTPERTRSSFVCGPKHVPVRYTVN
ncbi:cytochrome P450 [Sphingomonas lacunae]|uniref:Cytochrome P450 n=1 Tax=Sphingomonas lacunae TaxID=2698828 RepID=A0A6M4ASN1_9SPHN|nr:cytochrome P450 [Sphingomonas lacunae]QJQ32097.1 cytochrome P450 [Sphingomonas lacunae]